METGQTTASVRLPPLGRLAQHEVCFILRRRAGLTQREVAAQLGRSTRWVTMMEIGEAPIRELWEFWRE